MNLKFLKNLRNKAFHVVIRKHSNEVSSKIRNIGIIAHIDAGKTTTTESMLYHAGAIKRMGKVDSGNTVTDFLPSERARGITVQSAAVSFNWNDTCLNLIDTPGHVDFTVEVERALHVLDGAVTVLDGSRGVEAQTRTVWRQADKLNVPRIVFVNKMDKSGADFAATVLSLQESLSAKTFIIQFPVMTNEFSGLVDIVNGTVSKWQAIDNPDSFCTVALTEEDNILWKNYIGLKQKLIEQLADLYDDIANMYLTEYTDRIDKFPSKPLVTSLSHAVKNFNAIPILCGSAVKDIGVPSLLDSVIDYLPSPDNSNTNLSIKNKDSLVGYAFKVVHHKRFGPVVFIRVLSGSISTGNKIFNGSKDHSETVSQLYTVFADEYKPISKASEGQIVAITGLKFTGTGDTLFEKNAEANENLAPVTIPQPVYFCTIEADTQTELKALNRCLTVLIREDPSIRIKMDSNSGQTILCGMGELHMDILIERIKNEFKTNCYIGPIQVAYRETLLEKTQRCKFSYNRTVLEKTHNIEMELTADPIKSDDISISTKITDITPEVRMAIKDGILQACQSGPMMGFPLMRVKISVRKFKMTSNSPKTIVTAAVVNMVQEFFSQANFCVLEPMMDIEIVTHSNKLDLVLKSLAQKHATISEVKGYEIERYVSARAPVSEMLGFASKLRSISSGNADLTLEVCGYEVVSNENIETLRSRLIGGVSYK
ncbi:ribosome-releasing factor 2, mitochondrial-like [Styela clava]